MLACDFYVFGLLKKHLNWQRFISEHEVKNAVKDLASSRSQNSRSTVFFEYRCAQVYGAHIVVSYLFI